MLSGGDQVELRVTPDRYVTIRYAGASGDFNPIHVDEQFARQVGLPGTILHGLWSMAQVARAAAAAAGDDPTALVDLSVQFRGLGRPEREILVSGVVDTVQDGLATLRLEARQGDTRLIRNAVAHLRAG